MLVVEPNDPAHLALRATFGLLVSSDGGATWDWVCESAMGYSGNEDPSLVIAGDGAIVVGTFTGTARSNDGGCHWSRDPSWPKSVVDLASRPSAPDQLYAVSCAFSAEVDAGNLYASQLSISTDAGAHWSPRATLDPSLLIDSIEVAPSDAARVYVSAVRRRGADGGNAQGVLLRSDDDGSHWKEMAFPFTADDRGVYIAAIDPHDASRVYLRTSGIEAGRVVVTEDGGKTMREVLHGGPMQGFALGDDGASIFAGGAKDGLLRASVKDYAFGKMSSAPVQCLTSVGSTLWECAPTVAGYVLGASSDHGATFAPKLTLGGLRGPLKCDAPSDMDKCTNDWAALEGVTWKKPVVDAALAPSPPTSSSSPKRSFVGCSVRSGDGGDDSLALGIFLAVLAFVRRRAPWINGPSDRAVRR